MKLRWDDPGTVASFSGASPNPVLMAFAERIRPAVGRPRCLDLGCGAARNALPLATLGYEVVGTDLSLPMLEAARGRIARTPAAPRVHLVHSPMAPLPLRDASFDLVVAHGIWNLAPSGAEFRAAVSEGARAARPGAGLFLFTFARATLSAGARPDAGEQFVYSSWNGDPACFLTEEEIVSELGRVGFVRDAPGPMTIYNLPKPGQLQRTGGPVIYEGTFVRR